MVAPMRAPSALGLAQDQLAVLLTRRPRLQKTRVGVGWPDGGPRAPEDVWIDGTVPDWTMQWDTTGVGGVAPKDEAFELVVNLLVTRNVKTFVELRDVALELLAELQFVLDNDWQLAGVVQQSAITKCALSEGHVPDGARQCLLEVSIHVETYLTG